MTKAYRVALIDSISFSKFYVNKNLLGEYFGNMNECTSNEHGDLMIDALLKKINVEEITLDVFNIGDVGNLDMEVIKGHLNVIVSKSYDLVINNLLINMVDAEYYSYFSKIVNSNTLVISPGSEVFLFPNCIRCVWTVFGCSNCSGIEINFKDQAIYIGESVDLFECFSEIRQFENSNWGNCFYNIFFAFKYLNEISSCPLLDKMEILELISREKSGLHMSNNTSFGWINKNLFKDVSEYKFIIYPGLETSDILQNFGYFDNCYSVEGDFPMSGVMTNSDLLIHINPNYHEVKTISFDTTAKELYYGKFSDALDDGRIFYPGTFEDNDIKFTCDATKPSIIISSFFPGCQKLYCQIAFALYCHSAGIIVSNFCHNPLGLMYGFNYRMYFEPKTLVDSINNTSSFLSSELVKNQSIDLIVYNLPNGFDCNPLCKAVYNKLYFCGISMLLRPDVIIVCVTVDIPIESLLNLRKNCYGARVFYLLSQYRVDPLDYSFENKNMIQCSTKLQKAYLYEANEKGIEIYDFYSQHRMFSDILGYLKGD